MTTTTGYKVVIMSDLHLGMKDSSPKKILEFLNSIHTDLLILNGDIVDIDAMKRGSKWKNKHTKVVMKILDMSRHTEVIYVRGNHDNDLEELFGFELGNIKFVEDYIYSQKVWNGYGDEYYYKKFLIFHGDKIDVTVKYKFLSYIGSVGYDIALRVNTWYNDYRNKMGKPYFSISKIVKENVKEALSFINDFEMNACGYAKTRGADGVICGHIHIPSMKNIDGITYYNSGDWVENFSALVLTYDNNWELITLN
jgi:UDP-2,3-diacylglucosamine pyrophosphatase LpxH